MKKNNRTFELESGIANVIAADISTNKLAIIKIQDTRNDLNNTNFTELVRSFSLGYNSKKDFQRLYNGAVVLYGSNSVEALNIEKNRPDKNAPNSEFVESLKKIAEISLNDPPEAPMPEATTSEATTQNDQPEAPMPKAPMSEAFENNGPMVE